MKKILFILLTAYCLLLTAYSLLPTISFAQEQAGQDIAVLKAGVGARALGMGSAFTAISDNADAPYWNPAGLSQINQCGATVMQFRLSTDADYYYVSYVQPIKIKHSPEKNYGTIGISWVQVGLGDIRQTASPEGWPNEVRNLGTFSYFSNAYLLSYGYPFTENLSLGLTAKYLTSDMTAIRGGQAWGYSFTPGVLYKPSLNLSIGLKLDELLNAQKWGTGTVEQVPTKLRLGIGYLVTPARRSSESEGGGYGLLVTADVSQILKSGYSTQGYFGAEMNFGKTLAMRLGNGDNGWTAGVGFKTENVGVDYAYVTQRALSKDNVHRVALSGWW